MALKVTLWIVKEGIAIEGILHHKNRRFSFDPLLVMGDLLAIEQSDGGFDYTKHIFTKIYGNLHAEPNYIEDVNQALRLSSEIRSLLRARKNPANSMRKLAGIFNQYGVSVNSVSNMRDEDGNTAVVSYNTAVCNLSQLKNNDYWYTYTCHSVSQIVASIWQYYFDQGYHMGKCEYCGKLFARRTKKERLCSRTQPFINLFSEKEGEEQTCKRAVKYIRERTSAIGESINEKVRNSERVLKGDSSYLYWFRNERDKYSKAFRKLPSFENYRKYVAFLTQVEHEKAWHIR